MLNHLTIQTRRTVFKRPAPSHCRLCRRVNRWQARAATLTCLLLLIWNNGCGWDREQGAGVKLLLNTQEIGPGTTFELRFDEAMARSSMVGIETQPSPLVFKPHVPGRFVYTSARSGVMSLTEPLALGVKYQLTLRPGLRRADGQPASAWLHKRFTTPPFAIVGCLGQECSTNASSRPELQLWFNADVKAEEVAGYAGFSSAKGGWIAVEARQGEEAERSTYWWNLGLVLTWQGFFDAQRPPRERRRTGVSSDAVPSTDDIGNLVILTPKQALTVGRGWKLVVKRGLVSADGRLRLGRRFEQPIGDVVPFTPEEPSMQHVINQAPRLDLSFTKAVDPDLTNSFTNWVQISPWPRDLNAMVTATTLSLSGSWKRGTNYSVTLRRGLPAAEPFALTEPKTFKVEVPSVEPRLYFAAFSSEQFASGSRTFPLLAVNVTRIRVQAKMLEPTTAIHALRGFNSYFTAQERSLWSGNGYRRIDFNLVPGRTVFAQEIAGTTQEDIAQEIKLEWDQLLKRRRTGIVFLEAERVSPGYTGESVLGTQALIQLTDLGLVWKSAGQELQAFVFSYDTGQPISDALVQLYSEENELLGEARTDAVGLVKLDNHLQAPWLLAIAGNDIHAVRMQHNISTGSLGMRMHFEGVDEDDTRHVALFTDRDVYTPGETVHLKAVARDLVEAGLRIPAGLTSVVTCTDVDGKEFFTTNLLLNAFGSCSTSLSLPSGPRGTYELKLTLDRHDHKHTIKVAEYQPAAFQIALRSKRAYAPGEAARVSVGAQYLFGQPLHRARVQWYLDAQDQPFCPKGFDAFTFDRASAENQWGCGPGTFASSGETYLSESSNCVITAQVPLNSAAPQPRAVSLLVEVTDLNHQTLTRRTDFLQHSSSFYLGLKRIEEVLEPGHKLPIQIVAVTAEPKPWSEPVRAHLKLQRVDWQTVRVQGAGRTPRYRSEPVLTNLLEKEVTVMPQSKLDGDAEGSVGSRVEGILVPAAGEYLLEVKAQDDGGREVATSVKFDVTEPAKSLAWDYPNEVQIQLVPDQPTYAPGDTALILVKTPLSGMAWVTVERETLLRSFTTRLEGNAPAIEVPIETTDAPNVFVSVTVLRGAADSPHKAKEPEYRVGYCQIDVEDPGTRLQVEVTPGTTNAVPGELVTAEAQITSAEGEPVPNAEVTVYAVDDGVLSLTGYPIPDLHTVMFTPRRLAVGSGISLPFLLSDDPEKLTFQNKGYLGGGGGNERLRRRFLACAFWDASLRSDAIGKVTVQFSAPDSLTRYKIIAVAQTAANQFGSGSAVLSVSKPLMIEPALPRFAHITDRLQARAVVLNQTDHAGEVLVTLQLDGTATAPDPARLSQTIHVPAHRSAVVELPVVFVRGGSASWSWRARFVDISAESFTDAVRSTLDVSPLMPPLRQVTLVRVLPGETNLLSPINPQLLCGEGTVTVTVANTRVVSLGEPVRQLLHYPYGCAEQTGSSLLPWVFLKQTPQLLAFTCQSADEATSSVSAGVRRFFSMQTAPGGLAYWPGGNEPMLWASAYGGFVLGLVRGSGLAVHEDKLKSLLDYLSAQLRVPGPADDWESRCLALYALALAGRAEPAYHEALFQQRTLLTAEERALLALAIETGQGSGPMTDELLKPNAPPALEQSFFACPTREEAIRLLALLACRPKDPEADKLFAQLQQNQIEPRWSTTQGNAWALLAMRQFLQKSETTPEPSMGTLTWKNESFPFQLTAARGLFTHTFYFHGLSADKPLRLTSTAARPLFAQVAVESRSQLTNQLVQDHGLSLQRRYARLSDENAPQSFDTLRVGDRVLVTLRLAVHEPAQYLVVDDPLPSVFEAVNPEFKTQQINGQGPPAWMTRDDGDFWSSDFREIRTDRVLFFANDVPAGSYVIRYLARVRAAGTVTAPPAKAEEMYHPDRFGLTDTRALTSRATE